MIPGMMYVFLYPFLFYLPFIFPWALGEWEEGGDSGMATAIVESKNEMADGVARFRVAVGSRSAAASPPVIYIYFCHVLFISLSFRVTAYLSFDICLSRKHARPHVSHAKIPVFYSVPVRYWRSHNGP